MYNTAVIIFNIIVVIIMINSLINYFSHKSNTKQAENKATELAKELNNSTSEEVQKTQATQDELAALEYYYNLDLNGPTTVIEIESDEIQVSSLTENGRIKELVLTVFEAKIEIPFNFLNMLRDSGIPMPEDASELPDLRLALIDEKFYLLSIGVLSLVEVHRQKIPELQKWERERDLEKQVRGLSTNNIRGQIDSLPLSVVGERDATENENWYFDPSGKGIGYAIIMAIVFTLAPFNNPEYSFISLAACTAVLLLGFIVWYRANKAKRKEFKVKKLRGKFHEIDESDDEYYPAIYDNKKEAKTTFSIPEYWESKSKFPLQQEVNFEVLSGTNDIVSVGGIHSLEDNCKTNAPTRKYFPWMIITLIAFAINLGIGTNLQHATLAVQMLFAPSAVEVNTVQDWSSIQVGQRITANNINRQCTLPSEDTEPNNKWKNICDQFIVVEQAPNTDFAAVATPIIDDLKNTVDNLVFPEISDSEYATFKLQMTLMLAMQGQTNEYKPVEQRYIAQYDKEILSRWANWIEKNNKDNQKVKNKLLSMWDEIRETTCTADCWNEMLQGDSEEASGASIEKYNQLFLFEEIVDDYAQQQIKKLLLQWKDTLNIVSTSEGDNIQVTVIGVDTPHEAWDSLLRSYQSNYFSVNKGIELISTIMQTTEELHEMESASITSAVVSAINHGDSGTEIVLDSTMTDYLFVNYLIRGGLLLFILLFALWITRKELHPAKS